MSNVLTIAIPKGKLGDEAGSFLARVGFPTEFLTHETRKLLVEYPEDRLRYIICRPTDIPTFVEYGACDLGIVGKDTIVEANKHIFELLDLGFGRCRFVLAFPRDTIERVGGPEGGVENLLSNFTHLRVATKFPRVAAEYFSGLGIQVEIIPLHGNIELAPLVGLAEAIVDIVSTGKTLKENDLVAVDNIFEASARLVANRVSYRLKYDRISELVTALKKISTEAQDD